MAALWVLAALLPVSQASDKPSASDPSFPSNPRFAVQRFEEEHGMGAVTTTCLGQDAQGFLWIGTQTGLYRYDGTRATKMTEVEGIIGHYVVDLLIAPDGTPWFAGNRGVARYRNGAFEQVHVPATSLPFLTGVQVFAVDSRGMLYILRYKRGLLVVDPSNPLSGQSLAQNESDWETSEGITRGPDDSIWFTVGGQLAHLTAGSHEMQMEPGIRLPKGRIVALVFDGNGTLWVRMPTKLARLDQHAHKLVFEDEVSGMANDEEGKPSVDRNGHLLVPSSSGLYWQENGHWKLLSARQGLSSNLIQSALEDREGTLWIGGSGTGLDRLPGIREWSSWTTAEGLPDNSIWTTLRDKKGRLWVSTAHGIGIWDARSRSWQRVEALQGPLGREIRQMVLAGDGSVWAQTITGAILRINPDTHSVETIPNYRGRTFISLQVAPDGSVWATTRARLVRFVPQNGTYRREEVALPETGAVEVEYMAFSPRGALWATGPGGLFRYAGGAWTIYGSKEGLRGQTLTSLAAVNDNEAWIGYNDVVGVTHVKLDAAGIPHMEFFDWDRTVVGADSQGRMWFNGTDGIAILHPSGKVTRLSHASGLIWDDLSPWSGVREEADGSYLISTSRGLSRYKEAEHASQDVTPNVVLTSVMLGGTEQAKNTGAEVASRNGTLTVQFSPMVLDATDEIACWYQLNGLEKEPTQTQQREVHYGGLPPGDYEFLVQCKPAESSPASSRASFHFRVLPSVWQTWWARTAGAFLLLGGVWAFVSLRTRALNRRKNELEHAVAQRNAELMRKNKELEDISLTDPLTCTRNRRYFYETISTDIAQALRSHLKTLDTENSGQRQELIFALVDIDRFKRVNDDYGHAAGDKLLQEVAARIASVMRRSDDLVRWGGEEFLLVCRTTDRDNAAMLCNRVLEAVRETPFDVGNGVQVHKTCSIGWAPFPWLRDDVGMLSIENVIELADRALYLAKREGRNRSYGLLPSPGILLSDRGVTIDNLRDCPPELVQIV